jgi:enoyl-[acyl-carrier protein] reductase II
MGEFGNALDLYFGGDMEASIALSGQVAGRIDEVKPVAQVIRETIAEFEETIAALGKRYSSDGVPA